MTDKSLSLSSDETQHSIATTLSILALVYFMWGFITCLNDILLPLLKNLFDLSYTQAMLIQFCFFSAYFFTSIPSGKLVESVGYKRGLMIGLLISALGAFLFYPAAHFLLYPLFLGALFILACGITLMQVAANPMVSALGEEKIASSRLTFLQGFNSVGTTLAPAVGAFFILKATNASLGLVAGAPLGIIYLIISGTLVTLAAIVTSATFSPMAQKNSNAESTDGESLWQFPNLTLGAIAIFAYVGAEVCIGSFLISFFVTEVGYSTEKAASFVSVYWGCTLIGRFAGSIFLKRFAPAKCLAIAAMCATFLVMICMAAPDKGGSYCLLGVGLFNSIMFPTIFTMSIQGLGKHTATGSGVVCSAIVGGAVVPLLSGMLADLKGISFAFVIPVMCYLYILFYGWRGTRKMNG